MSVSALAKWMKKEGGKLKVGKGGAEMLDELMSKVKGAGADAKDKLGKGVNAASKVVTGNAIAATKAGEKAIKKHPKKAVAAAGLGGLAAGASMGDDEEEGKKKKKKREYLEE